MSISSHRSRLLDQDKDSEPPRLGALLTVVAEAKVQAWELNALAVGTCERWHLHGLWAVLPLPCRYVD